MSTSGGATGGGNVSLLGVVKGTDGATATPNAGYASFSTPFSVQVTTTATGDVVVKVTVSWKLSADAISFFALYRDATQVFNTGSLYIGEPGTSEMTWSFDFVDQAVAPGTHTYEVKAGEQTAGTYTYTLANAVVNPPVNLTSKGGSVMSVSAGPNL